MVEGLDMAAGFVTRGEAVALKSGRPHYEVTEAVLEASNRILRTHFSCRGMRLCRPAPCRGRPVHRCCRDGTRGGPSPERW